METGATVVGAATAEVVGTALVTGVPGRVTGATRGRVVVGAAVVAGPTAVGPTTSGGDSSPAGSWGVGSNDTQPAEPRYTWGQAWASAPRTVVVPSAPRVPPVKPMATRVGNPTARAITVKAVAKASQVPARVVVEEGAAADRRRRARLAGRAV